MKPYGFDSRLQHSIDLLRKSEKLAFRYSAEGFYLAFSGGKDSQALYHVAKLGACHYRENCPIYARTAKKGIQLNLFSQL